MDNKLLRVYFPGTIPSTVVTQIGTGTFGPGTTVGSLVVSNPQYYLENDENGVQFLCCFKTDVAPLTGMFGVLGTVTAVALPNQTFEFVGGRPAGPRK